MQVFRQEKKESLFSEALSNRYIGAMRTTLAVGNSRDRNVSVKVDYIRVSTFRSCVAVAPPTSRQFYSNDG